MRTRLTIVMISFLFLSGSPVFAKTMTYDFNDPKGVNAVSIVVDSMLEPNTGFAGGIQGKVTIDHGAKKIVSGTILVPAENITMSNPTMTKVLHSKEWLNAATNKTVSFTFARVISMGQTTDGEYRVTVQGDFTLNGITKQISAPVSLTFHPGKLGMRNKGASGDLVVLRTVFEINRMDFGIKPDMPVEIVGETIKLTLNIAGASG